MTGALVWRGGSSALLTFLLRLLQARTAEDAVEVAAAEEVDDAEEELAAAEEVEEEDETVDEEGEADEEVEEEVELGLVELLLDAAEDDDLDADEEVVGLADVELVVGFTEVELVVGLTEVELVVGLTEEEVLSEGVSVLVEEIEEDEAAAEDEEL